MYREKMARDEIATMKCPKAFKLTYACTVHALGRLSTKILELISRTQNFWNGFALVMHISCGTTLNAY
jgi:hypothetical protein